MLNGVVFISVAINILFVNKEQHAMSYMHY